MDKMQAPSWSMELTQTNSTWCENARIWKLLAVLQTTDRNCVVGDGVIGLEATNKHSQSLVDPKLIAVVQSFSSGLRDSSDIWHPLRISINQLLLASN